MLAPITVEGYTRLAGRFLAWRFGQGEVCLHDLRPTDAIAFVRHESKRLAPPALKGVTNALRSFLRFGEFRGEITTAPIHRPVHPFPPVDIVAAPCGSPAVLHLHR